MNTGYGSVWGIDGAVAGPVIGPAVDILNRMLRIELGAAAAYEHALKLVTASTLRAAFQQNRASHAQRSVTLAQLIEAADAEPAHRAGGWGIALELVEGLGAAMGESSHLRVIHELEKQGLASYETWVEELDATTREDVRRNVLSEQYKTVNRLQALLSEPSSPERPS